MIYLKTYIVSIGVVKALLKVPCHRFVKLNLHLALDLCLYEIEIERVVAAAEVDLTEDVLENLSSTLFILLV